MRRDTIPTHQEITLLLCNYFNDKLSNHILEYVQPKSVGTVLSEPSSNRQTELVELSKCISRPLSLLVLAYCINRHESTALTSIANSIRLYKPTPFIDNRFFKVVLPSGRRKAELREKLLGKIESFQHKDGTFDLSADGEKQLIYSMSNMVSKYRIFDNGASSFSQQVVGAIDPEWLIREKHFHFTGHDR